MYKPEVTVRPSLTCISAGIALFFSLLFWTALPAPASASHCGGSGERACCVGEHVLSLPLGGCTGSLVEGPPNPSGCAFGTCQSEDSAGFPSGCGGDGEIPCLVVYHIPSCKSGLVEVFKENRCVSKDSDGFPRVCGGDGERPCTVIEHIPSCKSGNIEVLKENLCVAKDSDGFPRVCGDDGERACTIIEHIPSCKVDDFVVEPITNLGRCVALDCGDPGERACTIVEHIPSCKPGTVEVTSFANGVLKPFGWCVDKNDFSTPLASWDVQEASPGPRTIFLIHGLGGNRDSLDHPTRKSISPDSLVGKLDDLEFDLQCLRRRLQLGPPRRKRDSVSRSSSWITGRRGQPRPLGRGVSTPVGGWTDIPCPCPW